MSPFTPPPDRASSATSLPPPHVVLRHAPPIVFMDRIVHVTKAETVTEWRVPHECPWVADGKLAESSLIEIAAQTAAAGIGVLAVRAGEPIPPGALGSIRNFVVHEEVRVGDLLRTTVTRRFDIAGASLVGCVVERISDDVTTIATGELGLVPTALL